MRYIVLVVAFASFAAVAPATASNQDTAVSKSEAADPDQKIRCRKVEVTGSLVKRGKVCKTVAEWRAIFENGNYLARKMVEDGTTRSGGQ